MLDHDIVMFLLLFPSSYSYNSSFSLTASSSSSFSSYSFSSPSLFPPPLFPFFSSSSPLPLLLLLHFILLHITSVL